MKPLISSWRCSRCGAVVVGEDGRVERGFRTHGAARDGTPLTGQMGKQTVGIRYIWEDQTPIIEVVCDECEEKTNGPETDR